MSCCRSCLELGIDLDRRLPWYCMNYRCHSSYCRQHCGGQSKDFASSALTFLQVPLFAAFGALRALMTLTAYVALMAFGAWVTSDAWTGLTTLVRLSTSVALVECVAMMVMTDVGPFVDLGIASTFSLC